MKDCPAKADLCMLYLCSLCMYLMMHGITHIALGSCYILSCVAVLIREGAGWGRSGTIPILLVITKRQPKEIR